MSYHHIALSLPGSGLDPLQIFEGAGILRSLTGTYQVPGANPVGVPIATATSLKRYVWTIGATIPLLKKGLLWRYVYAQESNLGSILLDDYDQAIAPELLNWGNRTAIGAALSNGDRYFRCPVVLTIPQDTPLDERAGRAGNTPYFRVEFQAYEVPV